MRPILRSIPTLLTFLALLLVPLRARADCSKDTDCKGDRVCINGMCQEPSSTYAPPPPAYVPPPPAYAPGPAYAPPPPPPAVIPPPPEEGLLIAHPHSWLSLVGVGYLYPSTTTTSGTTPGVTLAGGGLEYLGYLPTFRAGLVAGGVTLMTGTDLVGLSGPGGFDFGNSLWFGVGYDLGITRFIQFGPRIAIGYDLVSFSAASGSSNSGLDFDGLLLIGAHINVWVVRFFGFVFEVDGGLLLKENAWVPRIAGGIVFAW